ncbi:MAG: putative toxin-antitoxin system toxin component, PIN family [Bacteroidales bacterium]|nr:putative toxin-antitoxin system toxin component, PIN family [Bacteroidales bacterium]
MRGKTVILDTNLWISFLISENFSRLDEYIENESITLIFSKELIEEFIEVASRPKFKKFFKNQDIEKLLEKFDLYGKLIDINSDLQYCRDVKDNFLLNLAVDGKADFLVTGDDDLLVLKKIKNTKIITFKELIKYLER